MRRHHQKGLAAELDRLDRRGGMETRAHRRAVQRARPQPPVIADQMGRDEIPQPRDRHKDLLAADIDGDDPVQRGAIGHQRPAQRLTARDAQLAARQQLAHQQRRLSGTGGKDEVTCRGAEMAQIGQPRAQLLGVETAGKGAQSAIAGQGGGKRLSSRQSGLIQVAGTAHHQHRGPGRAAIGPARGIGQIRHQLQRLIRRGQRQAGQPAAGLGGDGQEYPVPDLNRRQIGDIADPACGRGPIGRDQPIGNHVCLRVVLPWTDRLGPPPLTGH